MTRQELNLAIFQGTADRPLWQPRVETWVGYHTVRGTLPERFRDKDILEVYDDLRCSVRYYVHSGWDQYYREGEVEEWQEPLDDLHTAYHTRTRSGQITSIHQLVREGDLVVNDRIREFPVKTPQDLQVMTEVMNATEYRLNLAAFEESRARLGDRGEPNLGLGSSGFTDLIKWSAGLLNTYYLLTDHPPQVEAYLEACDGRDDRQLAVALQVPGRIYNLGDHATNEFTPPPILKRYLLPRWQKISRAMTAAGRYVHSHWDGNSRTILPFLRESGLHGVEALPPLPMGDMTLEEIKAAVGDSVVVLDLIPTTHFLPHFSLQACLDFTKRVMDMFTPRLVLGVSDEISGAGDIARIEAISELVDDLYGLPD